MGTACGAPTRRYHGLLVAAATPPVDRVVALHGTVDSIMLPGSAEIQLSTFLFGDQASLHPDGWTRLLSFSCDLTSAIWRWNLPGGVTVSKTLSLKYGFNACVIQWCAEGLTESAMLRVQPLVLLRDFHALQHTPTDAVTCKRSGRTLRVMRDDNALVLRASCGRWSGEPQWWERFEYPVEQDRGYDHEECSIVASTLEIPLTTAQPRFELTAEMDAFVPIAPTSNRHMIRPVDERLVLAANQFVVARTSSSPTTPRMSIIAGYPWFADWGRDAMISLPGLLIQTGRLDDARLVLETFAGSIKDGLIPNRFDDRDLHTAHYNTADASLWFLHALHAWIKASGGSSSPGAADLLGVAMTIIDAHLAGNCPGVRIAEDGLIEAGIEGEALTWMDARINGVALTPRIGKPVELSALWHSGLRLIASLLDDHNQGRLLAEADRTSTSFAAFWNDDLQCCYDILTKNGKSWHGDASIRPNQIFAVSLPHSPLSTEAQRSVVETVREHLLTPYGLRTLSPTDPNYQPRFEGDMTARDTAYHNGTVWPWLIGPWCDAIARTSESREQATTEITLCTAHLINSLDHGCIGQIAEIYDAEAPHHPHGCPAQAWSVAELLRARQTYTANRPTAGLSHCHDSTDKKTSL
jgi:predicted glycogen debranching enzyme